MNTALPEILHCLNNSGGGGDVSLLERQQERMKWEQEHEHEQEKQSFFSGNEVDLYSMQAQTSHQFPGVVDDFMGRVVKPDPCMGDGWPNFGNMVGEDGLSYGVCGFGMEELLARVSTCHPTPIVADTKGGRLALQGSLSSAVGKESFKKRTKIQVVAEDEDTKAAKKIKGGCAQQGDSKPTQQQSSNSTPKLSSGETSADTSKEKSKVTEVPRTDYIHVRARRGQATDSHSLAERVRREKISERMKYLQDLVPGCNKITGKAGMLDEIINYVQSLQRQVEFLSMKLAAVNPRLDFNIENIFTKEVLSSSSANFPAIGISPEMINPAFLQLNALEQLVSCCGQEMGIHTPPDIALRRTISSPLSVPDTLIASSCFNQMQPLESQWDDELQNLYGMEFQQGRSPAFQSQQFSGSNGGGNVKMEM